jgi:ABC-type branched-subunit amino acid transport system ATPase component
MSRAQHAATKNLTKAPVAVLALSNVKMMFGRRSILRGATISIKTGEVVRLKGGNGTGKTVLLNIVSRYLLPTAGRVEFYGVPSAKADAWRLARAGLRRTFQTPRSFDGLTILESLQVVHDWQHVPALLAGLDSGRKTRGLNEHLSHWIPEVSPLQRCSNLSFGQRRMVELAQCFYGGGLLYVLDEPLSGLASAYRERVAKSVSEAKARNASILYVEHEHDELHAATDRTLRLAEGAIEEVVD